MQTTFQCLICSSIRIENNLTYQTTHRGFPGLRWLPSSEVPTIFPQDFSSFSVATAVLGQVLMIWNHFRCVPPVEGWFTCLNWSNTRFWGATQELIVLFEHWRENRADLLVNHICSYSHGQSGGIPHLGREPRSSCWLYNLSSLHPHNTRFMLEWFKRIGQWTNNWFKY